MSTYIQKKYLAPALQTLGITERNMKSRYKEDMVYKHVIRYWLHTFGISYTTIASMTGVTNHATVIYSVNVVKNTLSMQDTYSVMMTDLYSKLKEIEI